MWASLLVDIHFDNMMLWNAFGAWEELNRVHSSYYGCLWTYHYEVKIQYSVGNILYPELIELEMLCYCYCYCYWLMFHQLVSHSYQHSAFNLIVSASILFDESWVLWRRQWQMVLAVVSWLFGQCQTFGPLIWGQYTSTRTHFRRLETCHSLWLLWSLDSKIRLLNRGL